ncbi:PAS domain S-box protein [Aliifodinibius salicampi]|uniref:PAS domain S-box protein n=1 Tax=Fodinibius salicampi TaxID=1920655 RepID=A0ABT3Q283_9BACT|nr:PAS domain S-box protein [Fodinibius salicampi]MCW9714217.1 PAS domain S-box protein [Fodinibius salicampi]
MLSNNSTSSKIEKSLIDSLSAHIATMDYEGTIIQTNRPWEEFDDSQAQIKRPDTDENFFSMLQKPAELGNDYALKFIIGLKKVLRGEKKEYKLTYPIQTPDHDHWFKCTFRPLDKNGQFLMVHDEVTDSIKAKQQIEENKSRYQIQFEQSLDGILITDTKGQILDANPAAENILGRDHEDLVECSREDIMDIEDPVYQEALATRKKTGKYQIETDLIHKKGHKIPAEISSSAYRTDSGKLRAIVNIRDISRRKEIEQDLVRNKKFIKDALGSIPGAFFVLNDKGEMIRWNENLVTRLGYSAEELSGKKVFDFVVEGHKEDNFKQFKKCLEGQELSLETKITNKKGEIRDYYIGAKMFIQDGDKYVSGAALDVTEEKNIERENRRNQLMLEQLFQNAPVGIAIVDNENKIKQINKSFETIFGYRKKEIEQKDINTLLAPHHKKAEAEAMSSATQNGRTFQKESLRLRKDGQEVPVLIGNVPVEFQEEIIATYGIYVDISQQRQYRQKIEEALNEKMLLLSELHHRVKNNLALINSLVELQVYESDNEHLKKKLSDTQDRILTIASIHEVLYQSGDLNNIPFNKFIKKLFDTPAFKQKLDNHNITVNVDKTDLSLNINQAIPCGLLLNELFGLIFETTNVNNRKELDIIFRQYGKQVHVILEGDNIIESQVAVKKQKTLHNLLLETLVEQLNGTFLWPNTDSDYQKFECIFTQKNNYGPPNGLVGTAFN